MTYLKNNEISEGQNFFFQILIFFRKNCRIYVFVVADSKNRIFEPIKKLFDF